MRCREVREKLSAYAAGELPPEEREAVEAHFRGCPRCRREAEAVERAEAALAMLGAVETAPDLTEGLHRRMAERERRGLRWVWAGAGFAAVAVALAASLFMVKSPQRTPPAALAIPQRLQVAAPPPAAEPSPPLAVIAEVSVQRRAAPPARLTAPRRIVQRPAVPVTPAPEEHPADTRPIPEPEGIPPQPVAVQADDETNGVILLLGRPEPVPPSSSYYVVISFPNGQRSIREQSVQRDRTGRPEALRITYARISPASHTPHQGG
ncbi:MAG: zf-HC2 domain-containing protein [Armatimonadetes bacterium]|nr:zf-HC2 domain-containing protein [Armatimonadota bacterium]